jgi:hypothetical protein
MCNGLTGRPGNYWMGATKAALGVLLFVVGCTGYVQPPSTPPSPGQNPSALQCPSPPTTIPIDRNPPGMRFTNVALTCGGAGGMLLSIGNAGPPPRPSAPRVVATLADGSVFEATAIPVDGFGNDIVPTTGVHLTFGLQYTGDVGDEVNSSKLCVTQSKVTYTHFDTGGNLLIAAFEGTIKNKIHQMLDDTAIRRLSSITPSRCARWRQMP